MNGGIGGCRVVQLGMKWLERMLVGGKGEIGGAKMICVIVNSQRMKWRESDRMESERHPRRTKHRHQPYHDLLRIDKRETVAPLPNETIHVEINGGMWCK